MSNEVFDSNLPDAPDEYEFTWDLYQKITNGSLVIKTSGLEDWLRSLTDQQLAKLNMVAEVINQEDPILSPSETTILEDLVYCIFVISELETDLSISPTETVDEDAIKEQISTVLTSSVVEAMRRNGYIETVDPKFLTIKDSGYYVKGPNFKNMENGKII